MLLLEKLNLYIGVGNIFIVINLMRSYDLARKGMAQVNLILQTHMFLKFYSHSIVYCIYQFIIYILIL